jgi:hypothetical protein
MIVLLVNGYERSPAGQAEYDLYRKRVLPLLQEAFRGSSYSVTELPHWDMGSILF